VIAVILPHRIATSGDSSLLTILAESLGASLDEAVTSFVPRQPTAPTQFAVHRSDVMLVERGAGSDENAHFTLTPSAGIFSIIRGRGMALRLPAWATARVRPYKLRRYVRSMLTFHSSRQAPAGQIVDLWQN
jgi:hypothetical protein